MRLINCKIHLELNWTKNCVIYGHDTYADGDNNNNRETTFKITNKNLYDLIVTISTKDNVNLTKQLNEGFKRPVCWNEYKTRIKSRDLKNDHLTRFYHDASLPGATKLRSCFR